MISADGPTDAALSRAATGYRTTILSQGIRFGCKIAGVVVLARLVSPEEHGLFAMAASLTFLLALFRDFGAGAAAIQAPSLSQGQETALFWLHSVLGVVLAGLTLALAPVAASFYGEPMVSPLLFLMSGGFVLNGINAWPRTLLSRELRFAEVNLVETIGAIAGTVAMIVSGALERSAFAFAWFVIASEASMLVAAWSFRRWRPSHRPDWRALRELCRTGLNLTGYNLLLYGLQQSAVLTMGRWFGAGPVGLYSRTSQVLVQPVVLLASPFSQVLMATLSRIGTRSAAFSKHFCETTTTILHCTFPFAAVCLVMPEEVVWIVLGPSWNEAVPMLRWVALGAAATYSTATAYSLGVAAGRSVALTQATAASLPIVLTALWIGARFGALGMVAGVAVANALLVVPFLWWVRRGTPLSGSECFQSFIGPLGTSASLAAGMAIGLALAGEHSAISRLFAGAVGGLIAVAALVRLWPRVRREWDGLRAHVPFGSSRIGTPDLP